MPLEIDADGTILLPGNGRSRVKNNTLAEPIYGNQFVRHQSGKTGATFESCARTGRANGVVEGYIELPHNIKGMKSNGSDEGTVILKDNHGPGGDENKQYKVLFEYRKGGVVNGIRLIREHNHPSVEVIKGVKYLNQPSLEPNEKLEFKASYQDTSDKGVRLRMDYRDPKSGEWKRAFDHVDYGDGKESRPYRGKSGVQDGIRVDGSVNGEFSDNDDKELRNIRNKPISSTLLTDKQKKLLAKLASGAIWAREIEKDDSDLHDGIDDPLSFGER